MNYNVNDLTIKQKLGQLMWAGFDGYELTKELKELIDEYKIGNIILFTRNIKDIKQLYALDKEIHEYIIEKTGIMPFISIDQEGGMVTRIMDGATFCPGNMTLATASVSEAKKIGVIMGEELRSLGINYNLAPDVDVNNNPNNPVIGVRSYSDNPDVVAKFGSSFIEGIQSTGVIATAKHFPGHGDTNTDSHKALGCINHPLSRLEEVELVPFKKVSGTVKSIMTGHILFPALEPDGVPATLSHKIVTGILREKIGYEGIITSDCMEMKAIDDHYTTERGCVMGLQAGLDLVMVSHTYEKQVKAIKLIHEAFNNNELSIADIDKKVERILKVKEESYDLMDEYFYKKNFDQAKSIIDDVEHKKIAARIVDNSLTLVKGENLKQGLKTLVITAEPFATTIAEDKLSNRSIGDAIKMAGLKVDIEKITVSIDEERINELVNKAKEYEQVLVCTYNANMFTNQAMLVNALDKLNNNLFVLSTRSPYDLFRFRQIKNYLCLYEYSPNSVNTVVKYIEGEVRPTGKLPVNLSRRVGVGASLYVGLADYPIEKNLEYLDILKENGVENLFISCHMKEANSSFYSELVKVCDKADMLGIKVSLDINRYLLDDGFVLPKAYALRLDYGFSIDDIIRIYHEGKYVVELNASTISIDSLIKLRESGVDLTKVRISHNFYPKKYTGLGPETMIEKNKAFHDLGMSVMAYIPSSNMKRMPMYEGLPSLELHRNMNIYAILDTISYLGIDEVFFGDSYASSEELKLVKSFNYNEMIIPIMINSDLTGEELNLLRRSHINRLDENDYFVRSSVRSSVDILPKNTIERKKYSVTIDNVRFLRYQGEVGIMKQDLERDERVNVVGYALINDLVIQAFKPNQKFKFVIVGEINNKGE